jgi:hypothetical protein
VQHDDNITNEAEVAASDLSWSTLNAADAADIGDWGRHIGPLRVALRDAPEATSMHYWLRQRIETYAGHAAWKARSAMDRSDVVWEGGVGRSKYHIVRRIRLVNGPSELDTGVVHGPAGRDIEWGCHRIPRFED